MSSSRIPNAASVLSQHQGQLTVETRPIPEPASDEILVRNHAVAMNPVDWQIQSFGFPVISYPLVLGSDVCGMVDSIGSAVKAVKIGDHVSGFAARIYNNDINHGAFQTYTLVREIAVCKIPKDMTFDQGSVLPMAVATVTAAFFVSLGITRPSVTHPSPGEGRGILIWGASSSVGVLAVQIARDLGFRVYATAGKAHHEYVRSLGADVVIDYRDTDTAQQLIQAIKLDAVAVDLAFVTVVDNASELTAVQVVSQCRRSLITGNVTITQPWPKGSPEPDNGVHVSMCFAHIPFTQRAELGQWMFNEYLPHALEQKKIVPAPKVHTVYGGLSQVQPALDLLRQGVSGQKVVVLVD